MSVGDQRISVIHTLRDTLYERISPRNLCLDIPFFGTIRIASSGAVQLLEGERILGANPRHNPSSPRHGGSAVDFSSTRFHSTPNLPSLSETRVPQGTSDSDVMFTGNDLARNDTILQCSGGHLQLGDTPNNIHGGLDLSQSFYPDSDIIFFDSLLNTDLTSSWTF